MSFKINWHFLHVIWQSITVASELTDRLSNLKPKKLLQTATCNQSLRELTPTSKRLLLSVKITDFFYSVSENYNNMPVFLDILSGFTSSSSCFFFFLVKHGNFVVRNAYCYTATLGKIMNRI